MKTFLRLGMVLLGVVVTLHLAAGRSAAQAVTVKVVQVRASNNGEKWTDPALGRLGRRLERTYPYKNYKLVASDTQRGKVGDTLNFGLGNGMMSALTLNAFAAPMISMRVAVTEGATQIVGSDVRVPAGKPFILGLPWGDDKLIIAITPSAE